MCFDFLIYVYVLVVNCDVIESFFSDGSATMNARTQRYPADDVSLAIRQEIHRFESVHPSIYALYELTDALAKFAAPVQFQQELRRHIVCIEGLTTGFFVVR